MANLTEQNRQLIRALYDAAIAGDAEGVFGLLADDVVVREPGFLPYGGTYRGKDEFADLFGKFAKTYDMARIKVDHIVADGERVVGILRIPDLVTGKDVVLAEQSVIRDGKVAEVTIFFHDAQSLLDAPKM